MIAFVLLSLPIFEVVALGWAERTKELEAANGELEHARRHPFCEIFAKRARSASARRIVCAESVA